MKILHIQKLNIEYIQHHKLCIFKLHFGGHQPTKKKREDIVNVTSDQCQHHI